MVLTLSWSQSSRGLSDLIQDPDPSRHLLTVTRERAKVPKNGVPAGAGVCHGENFAQVLFFLNGTDLGASVRMYLIGLRLLGV